MRLADLLRDTGREAEADALMEAEEAFVEEWGAENPGEDSDLDADPLLPLAPTQPAPPPPGTVVRTGPKVSRNDPCPCGSGKKFKRCCGA